MRWRKTFVEIVTLSLLLAATQFCNGKTENLQSQTCNAAQMDCQVKSKSQFDQGGGGEAKEDEVTSEGTPSVGMGEVRGRLGNHLWGYLHTMALANEFGLEMMVSQETHDVLLRYFRRVRYPAVESASCGWERHLAEHLRNVDDLVEDWVEEAVGRRIQMERGKDGKLILPVELADKYPPSTNELMRARASEFTARFEPRRQRLLSDPSYDCPYAWELFMLTGEELKRPEWSRTGRHLHLFPGGNPDNTTKLYRRPGVLDTFLEDIRLKEEYEEKAEAVLQKVKGEHMKRLGEKKSKKKKKKGKKKKKDNSDDDLVFVGIHCRRTDYLAYQERYKRALLTPAYYLDAMHLFRDEFGAGRVAFVFVSDDMEWGRQKLMMRNKERDLYFAGDGRVDSKDGVGTDLAVLSLCNHTILSHGSFSYFAGALNGGIKVVPEHFAAFRRPGGQDDYEELDRDPIKHPLPRFHFQDEMTKSKKGKRAAGI